MSDELRSAINFVKSLDPGCMGIGYLPHDAGTYPLSAELIHMLEIAQSELQSLRKVAEVAREWRYASTYWDVAYSRQKLFDALSEWESNQ